MRQSASAVPVWYPRRPERFLESLWTSIHLRRLKKIVSSRTVAAAVAARQKHSPARGKGGKTKAALLLKSHISNSRQEGFIWVPTLEVSVLYCGESTSEQSRSQLSCQEAEGECLLPPFSSSGPSIYWMLLLTFSGNFLKNTGRDLPY